VVTVATEGFNQDGVVVISYRRTLLVYRRGHQPATTLIRPDESSLPPVVPDLVDGDPLASDPVDDDPVDGGPIGGDG
jgi:hypothetical protein